MFVCHNISFSTFFGGCKLLNEFPPDGIMGQNKTIIGHN